MHTTHHYNYVRMLQQPGNIAGLGAALGRNVRELREEQRFSKTALSDIAKINRGLITRIEKGEADVRLSYIERLADALCVDPLQLLEP